MVFSIYPGPIFSATLLAGYSGLGFYYLFFWGSPALVILGGIIGMNNGSATGPVLVCIGALGLLVTYGLSPAAIFGVIFLYYGIRWYVEVKHRMRPI